ncbi:ribonuclease T2 [Defluviimonas sp. WL0002]|uniref:Ribonuclease T2 n=1 Tax=Albidovulum marisflavi TaxID=2984159 RepID=A0ABT2Z924_9RHOB|nr:ribonuclease T2 [Defluviimonas sp. WL0002]MCV2867627.1 ribonuclease T2 [Defluviimonas sp. WL0002]
MRLIAALLLAATPAWSEGERAGDFDYYILSLTWSPGWCEREGDLRRAPECRSGADRGFTLHGLWPQYDFGWPSWCHGGGRDPSWTDVELIAGLMGSADLARHEWRKHGTCSGLDADAYFDLSRRAYDGVNLPDALQSLDRDVTLPASVVEDAFVEANPDLDRNAITITCKQGMIAEARICLTRDLEPRPCGLDAQRDCRMPNALMPAVR